MKRFIYIILFILCYGIFSTNYAQLLKIFSEGKGSIEIGLGYNKFFGFEPNEIYGREKTSFSLNAFYLTPTIRLNYQMEPLKYLTLRPFIGYDVFGGLEKSESSNEFVEANELVGPLFYSIEIGIVTSYKFFDFQIGGGIKYNNHLKISHKVLDEFNLTDTWFAKESVDLGLRLSYAIEDFTIASEFWFSITDLASFQNTEFDDYMNYDNNEYYDFNKNRFVLLIGYQF